MELDFLLRHRYAVLFAVVLVEQLGLPLPAVPFLLAAGALAGMGRLELAPALLVVWLAATLSDTVWYELGRRRGGKVLRFLCRLSLEPDSCVRRTEDAFVRRGSGTLLIAKFVPGLNTVAAPLAGVIGMRRALFLLLAGAGALLWAGTWMLLGWIFRRQLDRLAAAASKLGGRLGLVLALALGAWLLFKWSERRRFLRRLWITRVAPSELKRMMDAGEEVVIVDLRGRLDFEADPVTIPGAQRLDADEIEAGRAELPAERQIVLYCT